MSNKNAVVISIAAIAIVAILVAFYLYLENEKSKDKIDELEDDKLKLILDSLNNNSSISKEVKLQIEKLISDFKEIDKKVSNELAQALQLLQIGQTENAIEDLVKIIEHLLTIHYKDDSRFKTWIKEQKKRIDLHNMLEFSKIENKISEIEFQFYIAIKKIRNKEDHTLDLQLEKHINESGLITAIGAIFKLSSIVYPSKHVSN